MSIVTQLYPFLSGNILLSLRISAFPSISDRGKTGQTARVRKEKRERTSQRRVCSESTRKAGTGTARRITLREGIRRFAQPLACRPCILAALRCQAEPGRKRRRRGKTGEARR